MINPYIWLARRLTIHRDIHFTKNYIVGKFFPLPIWMKIVDKNGEKIGFYFNWFGFHYGKCKPFEQINFVR